MTDQDTPMVPPEPGELCSCGKPAVYVYLVPQHGRVPYCGQPGGDAA